MIAQAHRNGVSRMLHLGVRLASELLGVELPAGARKVELTFTSAPYETGKAITWAAILVALLGLAGGLFMERRRVA